MADMKNTGFGLLSEFGLDLPSEKDVRSLMRQKRIQDAMKFVTVPQGVDGRTRAYEESRANGFGMLGAALGNALGEKFRQPQTGYGDIPPEIKARLDTVKATKEKYAAWEASNANAPYEQRAEKYQEILAESAFKSGAEDIGINVLRELQDRRLATNKQKAELERLGYENDYNRATLDARTAKALYESNKEGVVTFYETGSQNPNGGLSGRLNADGTVTTADGRKLGLGEYTFDRPQWHPRSYGGGGGGGDTLGKPERANLRRTLYTAMTLNTNYLGVLDLVKEAGVSGGANPMGQVGKLTSLANRSVGHIEQLYSVLSPSGSPPRITVTGAKKNYDFGTADGRAEWARENSEWARKALPGLQKKGEYADRYIATITELAYAKAMAMEGGSSRSLSDNDFKNAFISIGGNINDPRALAKILLSDADRLNSRVEDQLSVYDPEDIATTINERGFERYSEGRKKLDAYRSGEAFAPATASPAPAGVDQATWDHMTPEEQALFK